MNYLIYKIEFHIADDYGIAFIYAHFAELGYYSFLAQNLLEIRHRIGVVQRHVAAKHINECADYNERFAVHINFKTEITAFSISKAFVAFYPSYGRKLLQSVEHTTDKRVCSRTVNGGYRKYFVFSRILLFELFNVFLRTVNVAFIECYYLR